MQLPVDTHVYRVSVRLGLIGKKVSPEVAHELLFKLLPEDAQAIHDFHKDLRRHSQRILRLRRPPLLAVSHYGSVRLLSDGGQTERAGNETVTA